MKFEDKEKKLTETKPEGLFIDLNLIIYHDIDHTMRVIANR
ncbi:MAG: hypothetical protein ACLFN4_03045 [Candidatus Acetothermia bacterium]